MHEILVDTGKGINNIGWQASNESSGYTISYEELHGGKQEGSTLLTIRTRALTITLIPTRGMGIYRVESGDMRLGWDSPIQEIVHPRFMNLESRNGLGWLEGFNEWMCRCGIEFSGHPGTDEFIDNVGNTSTMQLTLHGKIANIPCSFVEVIQEGEVIIVRSSVHERVFHGPKLELMSEIRVFLKGASFEVHDAIQNCGSQPQEYQLLYHCNFGTPLLGAGSKFVAAADSILPFNDRAAEGLTTYDVFEGPQPGFIEQVYKMTLRGDERGMSTVILHNQDRSRGVAMEFSIKELPCFTLWKNTDAVEDGYVTGLEPGTCFPHNRSKERAEGRVKKLQPREVFHAGFSVTFQGNQTEVESKIADIKVLAKRQENVQ